MNGEHQAASCGPHVGHLLWFMSLHMDNRNIVTMSRNEIMQEFNIDPFEADELIEQIEFGFAERIGVNQYRLTEIGIKEIDRMKQSVSKMPDCKEF
ncbi:MAG: hypothetical protein IJC66_01550 [Kiritimatiellae bacterium]|nr:hypothetical protein [Kiritimatiellia bacterium]